MLDELKKFETALKGSLSAATLTHYTREVERFAAAHEAGRPDADWARISAADVAAYLQSKGTGIADQNRTLSALRKWFQFKYPNCAQAKLAPFNVDRKQEPRVYTDGLTTEQIRHVGDVSNKNRLSAYRNFRLIVFLYGTGLRTQELLAMSQADVLSKGDPAAAIVVRGRPAPMQKLFLSEAAQRSLLPWLNLAHRERLLDPDKPEQKVWVNTQGRHRGKPMSPQGLRVVLQLAGHDAGLEKPLTPSLLRRTFRNGLVVAGVAEGVVRHLLGEEALRYVTGLDVTPDTMLREGVARLPFPWQS